MIGLFFVCVVAINPEWIAIVPFRLLSWVPWYLEYLFSRVPARCELEVAALFGWPTASTNTSVASPVHGQATGTDKPGFTQGWIIAGYLPLQRQ